MATGKGSKDTHSDAELEAARKQAADATSDKTAAAAEDAPPAAPEGSALGTPYSAAISTGSGNPPVVSPLPKDDPENGSGEFYVVLHNGVSDRSRGEVVPAAVFGEDKANLDRLIGLEAVRVATADEAKLPRVTFPSDMPPGFAHPKGSVEGELAALKAQVTDLKAANEDLLNKYNQAQADKLAVAAQLQKVRQEAADAASK